jgi:probable HAF family extracellular repeat protein
LYRSFIVDLNTRAATPLGILGVVDINDESQVVGISPTPQGHYLAFITGPGGVEVRDLGTLGEDYSVANRPPGSYTFLLIDLSWIVRNGS